MPSPLSLQIESQPKGLDDTPPTTQSPWQDTQHTLEDLALQMANEGFHGIPRPLRLAAPTGLQFTPQNWLLLDPTPTKPSHLFPLQSHFTTLDRDISRMRCAELDSRTKRYIKDSGEYPRFVDEWRFPLSQMQEAENTAKALHEQISLPRSRNPVVRRPDLIEHFSDGNACIVRAGYAAEPVFCSRPASWQHRITMAEAAAKALASLHHSGQCHGHPVDYNWLILSNPRARYTFQCQAIGLTPRKDGASPSHMRMDVRSFVWSVLPLDVIQQLCEWVMGNLKKDTPEFDTCKALTQAVECCYELNTSTPRQTPTAEELAKLTHAVNVVLAIRA